MPPSPIAVARPGRDESLLATRSVARRPFDPSVTGQRVKLGLAGAVIPDDPVALGAGRLGFVDRNRSITFPSSSTLSWMAPAGLALAYQCTECRVFAPCTGQDSEKPAAVLMDVGHVLGGGELAVGDIEEVAAAGQLAEHFPGPDGSGRRWRYRSRRGSAPARHHRADGEDIKQLLQVGAMVLVVTVGDGEVQLARRVRSLSAAS